MSGLTVILILFAAAIVAACLLRCHSDGYYPYD